MKAKQAVDFSRLMTVGEVAHRSGVDPNAHFHRQRPRQPPARPALGEGMSVRVVSRRSLPRRLMRVSVLALACVLWLARAHETHGCKGYR